MFTCKLNNPWNLYNEYFVSQFILLYSFFSIIKWRMCCVDLISFMNLIKKWFPTYWIYFVPKNYGKVTGDVCILARECSPSVWQAACRKLTSDLEFSVLRSVFVVSKTFEKIFDKKEKWYGTQYKLTKIPSDVIQVFFYGFFKSHFALLYDLIVLVVFQWQKWSNVDLNQAFKLPKPNKFIATNFDIKPRKDGASVSTLKLSTCFCCEYYLFSFYSSLFEGEECSRNDKGISLVGYLCSLRFPLNFPSCLIFRTVL